MSLKFFNRVAPTSGARIEISGINLQGNVQGIRGLVSEQLKIPGNEIELLYGGEKLRDDKLLSSYKIKSGVTIHVVKRAEEVKPTNSEKMSRGEIREVVKSLQVALLNPAYRNTVEQMMAKPETLQNLIATTPALDRDPVAIAMLQDPDLLGILADPKYIDNVMGKHPSLAQAAAFVTAALRSETTQTGALSSSGRRRPEGTGHYSLDRLSDDEEDMDTSSHGGAQPITAGLLASALAAAASQRVQQPGASTSADSGNTSSSGAGGGGAMAGGSSGISSDFFRSVLQQAMGGGSSQQTQQNTEAQLQSQLQQLREMGITDENVARQALIAAGGDIQGALEIIYGEDL